MEAKELMIGDWVDIQEDGKHLKYTKVHDLTRAHDEEYYYPIPLTEEILKANANPHIKYENICGYLSINIRKEGLKDKDAKGHFPIRIVILDGKVIFVHQLQHALRLCGLNELADNFKV